MDVNRSACAPSASGIDVPDDFDTIFADEIEREFYGGK